MQKINKTLPPEKCCNNEIYHLKNVDIATL